MHVEEKSVQGIVSRREFLILTRVATLCVYKIHTYASFQRYFCTDFYARGKPPPPSPGCGVRHRLSVPKAVRLVCVRTASLYSFALSGA